MDFLNVILDWFKGIFGNLDAWLKDTIALDDKVLTLYQNTIAPLAEWIKIVGLLFIAILLVFGIFGFIKKLYKLFIVLIIIGIIIGVIAYFV